MRSKAFNRTFAIFLILVLGFTGWMAWAMEVARKDYVFDHSMMFCITCVMGILFFLVVAIRGKFPRSWEEPSPFQKKEDN